MRWRNSNKSGSKAKKTLLDPLLAARTLILAQACAYAGTVLLGWHVGIFLDQLRIWSLRSDQGITWLALGHGRRRPGDDRGGARWWSGSAGFRRRTATPTASTGRAALPAGRPPGKANMRTEAIDPPGINWQRVSPRYVTVRLVEWAIREPGCGAGPEPAPLVFVLLGWWRWPPLWLAITVPAAMLVLAFWRLVLIPRQVRAIGYAERDDDLLVRGGIFFQRTMAVPYGRMQYVDIAVGPRRARLGLCTLKLHTASPGTNATHSRPAGG